MSPAERTAKIREEQKAQIAEAQARTETAKKRLEDAKK